jgi:DNA-binding NtrC family response regulator
LWQINLTVSIVFVGTVIYDKAIRIKNLNQKIRELENEIFTRLVNLDQIDKMIHSQTEQYKAIHYFANELRSVLQQPEVEQKSYLEKLFLSILENQEIIKEQLLQEINQLKAEKERVQFEKEKLEFQKNLYERFIDSDREIQSPPVPTETAPEPAQMARDVLLAFQYFQNQSKKGQSDRIMYQGMVALASIPNAMGIMQKTPMGVIFEQLKLVSGYDSTVLITGEPGTGKELVAKAIHELSPRNRKPLVTVNCAAIPENLLESELFGHVRGAFTHALSDRIGTFERADGGTIFLDEIGELKHDLQAKLLRVLQEKEFQKVGSNQMIQVNVRIIAATNKDLDKAVQINDFRSDLYFRLNVVNLHLPPLRARKYDIPFLVQFFIKEFNARYHQQKSFVLEAMLAAMCYDWPGNIRMLQHFVEKMGVMTPTNVIQGATLPDEIQTAYQQLFQNNITPLWQEIVTLTRCEYERLVSACKQALQTSQSPIVLEENPLHLEPSDCYEYLRTFVQNLTSLFPDEHKEALVRKLIVQMQDELFQWCRQEKIAKLGNLYEIIEKLLGRSRRQIDNWRTQTTLSEQPSLESFS